MALSYAAIRAIIDGSPQELQQLLNHYNNYINHMSRVPKKVSSGLVVYVVDPDIKAQIQYALVAAVRHFELVVR